MSGKGGIYRFTNNASVAALIGVIAGGLVGYIAKDMQVHDVVTYNNISSYIESLLVDPGYVSEEVLEKESPFAQLEFVGQDISGKLKEANSKSNIMIGSVQSFLVETGEDADSVGKMDIGELEKELKKKSSSYKTLQSKLETSEERNKEYEKLTLAELRTPSATISGEQYSNPIQDYQAVINGHNYYLEEFLNSFLDYDLVSEEGTLYYHKGVPDRVKVTEDMFYDQSGYMGVLTGDEIYTMELEEYRDGLKFKHYDYANCYGEIKLSCKKKYSAIEFKIGHIDNGNGSNKDVVVYYQNDDGNFVSSEKIQCTGDMPVKSYKVSIYNTKTVKITSVGHGEYLLTDMYFVR